VLGIDVDETYSPSVLCKIVEAATKDTSYQQASETLAEQAELEISAKQCERVVQRIGEERLDEVARGIAEWEALPLPRRREVFAAGTPENSWDGRVAVIELDGGRAQVRDEGCGTKKRFGEQRSWWRETKAACLMTFLGRPEAEDPHPDLPGCLRDPLFAVPRFLEFHQGERGGPADPHTNASKAEQGVFRSHERSAGRWSPEPLVRSVTATGQTYDDLAARTRVAAWERGFTAADRKAFLGDGLAVNWRIHREYFSDYEPIVDLMHAFSYVYAAAVASSPQWEEGWKRYETWAQAVWEGRVNLVIEELRAVPKTLLHEPTVQTVSRAVRYLTNNASRMQYGKYRRLGLPVTTSHIESVQKQLNKRVKGTEKFWSPEGLEPMLQLRADRISETAPLDSFWRRRAARQTGACKPRAKT
jgi:hypothetical protein